MLVILCKLSFFTVLSSVDPTNGWWCAATRAGDTKGVSQALGGSAEIKKKYIYNFVLEK